MKISRIREFKNFSLAAAILVAGVSLTACSSSDDIAENNQQSVESPTAPKTCTLTVNATKGDDATTRALSLDGSTLNATWTAGDKVAVYYMGGESITSLPPVIGTLTAQTSGTSTTLIGEIKTTGIEVKDLSNDSYTTYDLKEGDILILTYSGTKGEGGKVFDMNKQDGTLQTLADYFDNASAEVTVSSVSGSTVTITENAANFGNDTFIIRFTLKDSEGNLIRPSKLAFDYKNNIEIQQAEEFGITIPSTTYETNGDGKIFATLPSGYDPEGSGFKGIIGLIATVGGCTYTYEKSDVTFARGKFYDITVKMKKKALAKALKNGAEVVIDYVWNYQYTDYHTIFTFTNNNGTYSCEFTGGNDMITGGSLEKEGNTLVFKVTAIPAYNIEAGSTIVFYTESNTYDLKKHKGWYYQSITVSVNGIDVTSQLTELK